MLQDAAVRTPEQIKYTFPLDGPLPGLQIDTMDSPPVYQGFDRAAAEAAYERWKFFVDGYNWPDKADYPDELPPF